MDRTFGVLFVIAALVGIFFAGLAAKGWYDCHQAHGAYVRTAAWYACIDTKETK